MRTAIACLSATLGLFAADPLIGTWKIDPTLTKTEPPSTLKVELDGDFIRLRTGTMDARFKFDLRDYPVGAETVFARRIGPNLYVITYKTGDRVSRIYRQSVSQDGKSMNTALRTVSPHGATPVLERTAVRIGGAVDPSNPILGEWRYSEYTYVNAPAMRFEAHGDGHRYAGTPGYTAAYDGKDYHYLSPASDAVSLRRIDQHTVEATFKKDGKARSITTLAVSSDGVTLTLRSRSTAGSGSINTRTFRRHTPHPLVGSWKLNPAKSKLGDRPMQSATLRFSERPEGLRYFFDAVDAAGKGIHRTAAPESKKIGERVWLRETLRDGKVISSLKHEISADGKVLTSTITAEQGDQVRVYERDDSPPTTPRAERIRQGTWKLNQTLSWRECPEPKPVAESIRTNTPGHSRTETRYIDGSASVREFDTGGAVERKRDDGGLVLSIVLDDSTIENTARKDGVLTNHSHSVVSSDGNTYTLFGWSSQPGGQRCSFLTVLDRVK